MARQPSARQGNAEERLLLLERNPIQSISGAANMLVIALIGREDNRAVIILQGRRQRSPKPGALYRAGTPGLARSARIVQRGMFLVQNHENLPQDVRPIGIALDFEIWALRQTLATALLQTRNNPQNQRFWQEGQGPNGKFVR